MLFGSRANRLQRLDRNRVLGGKPKYETVEGMIDSYVEEATKAGLGWSREDAESEVVRYLRRQALADEGGFGEGGAGPQDTAAFALLGLLAGLATLNVAGIELPTFESPVTIPSLGS